MGDAAGGRFDERLIAISFMAMLVASFQAQNGDSDCFGITGADLQDSKQEVLATHLEVDEPIGTRA